MSCEDRWSVHRLERSDFDEYASIAGESLLGTSRYWWACYLDRVGRGNVRGVFSGDQLVGGLGFYRMGQWFGGRRLSAAGISGVAINPAKRGRGAARELLSSVLSELRSEGIAVATLYASTQRLYRAVGFEQAGTRIQYRLPLSSVPKTPSMLEVHRTTSHDFDRMRPLAAERARRSQGNLDRSDGLWQRLVAPSDATSVSYLVGSYDAPQGYVIVRRAQRGPTLPQPLDVFDIVALTPAAARTIWSFLAGHSALHDVIRWFGPPADPLGALVDGSYLDTAFHQIWMTRIVDLPAALQSRGYPDGLRGSIDLDVQDNLLKANNGRWRLRVCDGKSTVMRGGDGTFQLSVRALAPLLTGHWRASQLTELGWLRGASVQDLELADRLFSSSAPWMPDAF